MSLHFRASVQQKSPSEDAPRKAYPVLINDLKPFGPTAKRLIGCRNHRLLNNALLFYGGDDSRDVRLASVLAGHGGTVQL